MANETTEKVELQEEVTDEQLFREARDEPVKETEETPAQTAERQRDEKGRFVKAQEGNSVEEAAAATPPQPVETPAATTPAPEPHPDEGAQVPSWRLREEREAREAAMQRSYAMQSEMQELRNQLQKLQAPKQEPVDFFADPDKAIQQHLQELRQEIAQTKQDMRLATSRSAVIAKHGFDQVAKMETAVAQAMQQNHPDMAMLAMQMRASEDPANVAMQWFENRRLHEATGGNLEAYNKKLLEDAKKDPKYVAEVMEYARSQAGSNGSRPAVNLPPSLNKATGSAGGSATDDGDMSDRALFKHAMNPR